jgi:tripartite-type tricarboxylate transporter receptor subunit TctC
MTWSGGWSRIQLSEKARPQGVRRQSRRRRRGARHRGGRDAAPDGYTLLVVSIAHAVNPALYKLNYDPIKSFAPISIMATGPNVLAVNPTLPVKNVKELVALAKEKPGSIDYASPASGSFQHLGGELFKLSPA